MLDSIEDKITVTSPYAVEPRPPYQIKFDDSNNRSAEIRSSFENYSGSKFMSTKMFPHGLSKATLSIKDALSGKSLDTILIGGFLGVKQDVDGNLTPITGYGLVYEN